jgi:DNA-binding NarL/FixJ family response regulator
VLYSFDVPIRVVIVDDHPIVLQGLQALFERQADIDVGAACSDGSAALDAVRVLHPDVLVMDLKMPGRNGLDLLRTVAAEQPGCRCVLLTATISHEDVCEAIKLGARGVVLKDSPPDSLVTCIRRVYAGDQWIDQDTATRAFRSVLDRESAEHLIAEALTPRELEIVRMVAQGLRNKAIAERLGISEGTVKVHLHNIYDKLGVDGRMELLLSAQQRGLT